MKKLLLRYLGAIIVLLGVLCIAIYHWVTPLNSLLVLSLVLEVAGILTYIIVNRRLG